MCTAARAACFIPSEISPRTWASACPRHQLSQDTDPQILSAYELARLVLLIPQDIINKKYLRNILRSITEHFICSFILRNLNRKSSLDKLDIDKVELNK